MALDFFRSRLDGMVDLRHPLCILADQLPWERIEQSLAPRFTAKTHTAGRPRKQMRLMVALLMLKHNFNLSDEALVIRFSENVVWQYFAGYEYYDPSIPCDATQIGRFRSALGEQGLEEILRHTIEFAVDSKAIKPQEFERIIVDTTVQEKAIAHPTDARLLDIARRKLVKLAKQAGIPLKQTFEREGKGLRWKASGYAHAKQFKRLRSTIKRQRTVLGIVIREIERKAIAAGTVLTSAMIALLERAKRIYAQQPKDKNKLYALHAPEVECIGKGKARAPYEFGVKVSIAITHKQGLMIGARSFAGNPYDGHLLYAQMEQTVNLLEGVGVKPTQAFVDLSFRGKDVALDNPGLEIIHKGKYKSLSKTQRKHLRRRSAIEPAIGHLKADHRMARCYLKGALGDAHHALSCAIGYNIAWLLRAIARLGLGYLIAALVFAAKLWRKGGFGGKMQPIALQGVSV
jgi:IS5 family transposase